MSKKEVKQLVRILIASVGFVAALLLKLEGIAEFLLYLATYLIVGGDIIWKAIRNISRGQVFDENFLMSVATIGAFCLGEYSEGIAVMLFYQVGELFQSYAVSKSRRSISELMDIRPDYANVLRNGELIQVDPEEVQVNEIVVVKPGERIPLDGVVTDGFSAIDTSALTGESVPREVHAGENVISGCINQTGKLTIQVNKEYGQSTVAKILELVENSSDKKSKSENFITKFARYYTPIVVFAAVILAIIPPLITDQSFGMWIERALTFLVISCPCALVISVPLSFFGGIGGASKSGVLVKGSNYLEAMARTEMVVFDKTGTLTKGSFAVSEMHSDKMTGQELLELAAYAEDYSNHPIAQSIKKAFGRTIDSTRIKDIEEIAGHGVKSVIDGKVALAGNAKLMKRERISYKEKNLVGTVVHLAVNKEYIGYILIEDEIKEDAARAIAALRSAGIKQTVMLTGDADAVGKKVAATLKLDKAYTELLPADKVERMEELMKEKSANGKLAFVGDGINDAPVLARADIGIAMGGLGSDAAIEAADVVIMTDEPSKIATVMKISKKTLRIVKQNIIFALGVKGIVLVLGALGITTMWGAVFADVGVSVIAIINAIRALNVKKLNTQKTVAREQGERALA
ncbi:MULTISPECIES: heavy metal translocating P-type ATPase [Paenibacillus]|uniref:Cadmium-translocating P-type ATPase n=1 Tax=Paenibacillus lautus TaxID=1401 RepID=A0A1R1B5D0_PAELA|nr:heavy metal translocating P-type ATPase [Paenibacillus lautus]OME94619.1 cadmium-translocating P-type ATPase [Paenibacillus lautus]